MNQYLIGLLKRLSIKLGGANDLEVSKRLNVPRSNLAEWRMGTKLMDKSTARVIAGLLGEDPDVIELEVGVACAQDQRLREAYSRLLEQKRAELARS